MEGCGETGTEWAASASKTLTSFRSRDVAFPPLFRLYSIVLPVWTAGSVFVTAAERRSDISAIHRSLNTNDNTTLRKFQST